MPTYTVPEVPGSKRTSDRPYTHALVGRVDVAAARRAAVSAGWDESDRTNYAFYRKLHDVGVGGVWSHTRGYEHKVDQRDYDGAKKIIDAHPTLDGYLLARREDRLNQLNEKYGATSQAGPLVVLQWSMSAANAAKAEGTWRSQRGYIAVRVVECVPVEKKAKKAPALVGEPGGSAPWGDNSKHLD
jgi:hypothetical protein